MAWRRSGDKPLSEPIMVGLATHICVTWPQWVKHIDILIKLDRDVYRNMKLLNSNHHLSNIDIACMNLICVNTYNHMTTVYKASKECGYSPMIYCIVRKLCFPFARCSCYASIYCNIRSMYLDEFQAIKSWYSHFLHKFSHYKSRSNHQLFHFMEIIWLSLTLSIFNEKPLIRRTWCMYLFKC